MSLYGELQKFDPDSVVAVFVLYDKDGNVAFRFHSGVNEFFGSIYWQGEEYAPMPIETEGFDLTSDKFPRPKIRIGNFQGAMSDVVVSYDDLIGYKVVRKKTLALLASTAFLFTSIACCAISHLSVLMSYSGITPNLS